jgi:agmatinase
MDISLYNPNDCSFENGNLVGLPFDESTAKVVLLPIEWDATVSYKAGTSGAPEAIRQASYQLDVYDPNIQDAWKLGIFMRPSVPEVLALNRKTRKKVCKHIALIEQRLKTCPFQIQQINKACNRLQKWVFEQTSQLLDAGKLVGLVGGEHSTPFGYLRALAQKHNEFGILHIDAHLDMRAAYEELEYSHASIFYNTLTRIPNVSKFVSVGIRDYCQEEVDFAEAQGKRVHILTDDALQNALFEGETYQKICQQLIAQLPDKVYISFDIDGLKPNFCPDTGTPVPSGLEYAQAVYLIEQLVKSGRQIIGFDLSEIGRKEWDANVGARLLYKISNLMGRSQKLI